MSSWFGNLVQSIKEGDLQKVVDQTSAGFEQLTTSVKQAAAQVDKESNDLRAQKHSDDQITALPWEEADESKSILVDDLMERILSLSVDDVNFTTEPSPPTEFEFVMERHVNVIMRLIQIDPNLAHTHYRLSSKMDESVFWRNYFHRCAVLRAEVGLSSPLPPKHNRSTPKAAPVAQDDDDAALEAEVNAELEEHLGDIDDDLDDLGDIDADLEAEIAAELEEEGDDASNGDQSPQSFDDELAMIDDELEKELAEIGISNDDTAVDESFDED